jgi:hypothetical protein
MEDKTKVNKVTYKTKKLATEEVGMKVKKTVKEWAKELKKNAEKSRKKAVPGRRLPGKRDGFVQQSIALFLQNSNGERQPGVRGDGKAHNDLDRKRRVSGNPVADYATCTPTKKSRK